MRLRLAIVASLVSACGLDLTGSPMPDGGVGPAPIGEVPTAQPSASAPVPTSTGSNAPPEPDAGPPAPDAGPACGGADLERSLEHCGACNAACPARTTRCEAGKCIAELQVRVGIDGDSYLRITGNRASWRHVTYAAPGRHGVTPNTPTMNGQPFAPDWPAAGENYSCNCDSGQATIPTAPLPSRAQNVGLRVIAKRKTLDITEQPSSTNGYRLVVHFDDVGHGDSAYYEGVLTYETR